MTTKYAVRSDRLGALDQLQLSKGSHLEFDQGHCAMEVVAWLAGLGHTDAPACASPVLTKFTTSVNDIWDDQQRQKLKPYLTRMVGTSGDSQDEARSYLALDWLVRTYTPAWLDLAGLTDEARELRDLPQIVDKATAEAAVSAARKARKKTEHVRDVTRYAAGDAAAGAAWGAAADAAGDAAWGAAWDTTWDSARNVARNAAYDTAYDAAYDTAYDTAYDAAYAAAYGAAYGAYDAAWDALRPTVEILQASALDLLDAMIDPSKAVQA